MVSLLSLCLVATTSTAETHLGLRWLDELTDKPLCAGTTATTAVAQSIRRPLRVASVSEADIVLEVRITRTSSSVVRVALGQFGYARSRTIEVPGRCSDVVRAVAAIVNTGADWFRPARRRPLDVPSPLPEAVNNGADTTPAIDVFAGIAININTLPRPVLGAALGLGVGSRSRRFWLHIGASYWAPVPLAFNNLRDHEFDGVEVAATLAARDRLGAAFEVEACAGLVIGVIRELGTAARSPTHVPWGGPRICLSAAARLWGPFDLVAATDLTVPVGATVRDAVRQVLFASDPVVSTVTAGLRIRTADLTP